MENLAAGGAYTITEEMKEALADFYGNYCTEEETAETIKRVYEESGYILDTHTAVASGVYEKYRKESGDETPVIIASTASPYKFARSVMRCV